MTRAMLYLTVAAAVVAAAVCTPTAAVPPDEPKKPTADVPRTPAEPKPLKLLTRKEAMDLKLKNSQVLLEGIALNDFAKVEKAANSLIAVSNLTEFLNAYKGAEYQFHVRTFRQPAETIAKRAKEQNMDGVVLAYTDLTLSCLKCHRAMRDKTFELAQARPAK